MWKSRRSPSDTGRDSADWWGVTTCPRNALFMRDVDAEGFFELLTSRLARL